jgi:hypothetical protein
MVKILRVRVYVPLPHDFEHGPGLPQFDTSQFTAHFHEAHAFSSHMAGHALPPYAGPESGDLMVRLRVCTP